MLTLTKTNSDHLDFQSLVAELDADLSIKNGETNDFFAKYNKIDLIQHVVVGYVEGKPVGCGAMKEFEPAVMEIKRMYVQKAMRGRGVAIKILKELEEWAKDSGYSKCVLETGYKMPEAIGLYRKCKYQVIPNYGQYENVETSICFEKVI